MKSYVFVLVLTCFTTLCAAQDIRYGIRGALNVSNLDFDPDATFDNEHRIGFAFAGFVDFGITEDMSIRTELQWSAEGGKDESLRADYIQLPILLRLYVLDRLSFGIGPQINLKTWSNEDGFSTFAISGIFGAEYMLTDELFIDLRYSYGLTNILDEEIIDVEAKNHVMQFGFGIKI
jgi:opacity protein-like surface antigen